MGTRDWETGEKIGRCWECGEHHTGPCPATVNDDADQPAGQDVLEATTRNIGCSFAEASEGASLGAAQIRHGFEESCPACRDRTEEADRG